jgi:hypothetical protein
LYDALMRNRLTLFSPANWRLVHGNAKIAQEWLREDQFQAAFISRVGKRTGHTRGGWRHICTGIHEAELIVAASNHFLSQKRCQLTIFRKRLSDLSVDD